MHQSTSALRFPILPAGFGPNVVLNVKCKAKHVAPHPISQIPALRNDTKTKTSIKRGSSSLLNIYYINELLNGKQH